MNDKPGLLNSALNQLGTAAKQSAKDIAKTPVNILETAVEQAGVKEKKERGIETQVSSEVIRQQQTEEFVDSLYAPSNAQEKKQTASFTEQIGLNTQSNTASLKEQLVVQMQGNTASLGEQLGLGKKTPSQEQTQTQQQMAQTQHQEYYQGLSAPKPKTEEEVKEAQEERETPQQRMERLKIEDENKKREEQAKKDKPIDVQRAEKSTETFRGVSG